MEYTPEIPMKPKNNRMALWSMILGIVGWVTAILSACVNYLILPLLTGLTAGVGGIGYICGIPLACVSPIVWILAIIFGHVGKKQIRTTGEGGNGMATAGLIMGYIAIGLTVILLCIGLIIIVAGGGLTALLSLIGLGEYYYEY